jgi:hypothetical protein
MTALAYPAEAQPLLQRAGFFDRLFGTNGNFPPAPPPPQRGQLRRAPPPRHHNNPAPRREPRTQPAAEAPPPVQKMDNARKVLVVGDFLASGLADGLKEAFTNSPGVVIVDKTNGSSGLVRNDYYDWPAKVGPILDEVKPAIAIVLIGSNDRQQMVVNGTSEPVRSDQWTAEYTRRAKTVADAVVSRHIPLIWVGVPAFESPSMSADILAFDGIFRSVVSKAGGEFIDTWDGFVDENGNFIFTGSDINGQQVRLRRQDGINFTDAGKRKLAFYVEKPARRILGSAADTDIGKLTDKNLPDLTLLPPQVPTEIVRTEPMSFTDPAFDGGETLLGGAPMPVTPDAPRTLLVRDGKIKPPPPGRADNFQWHMEAVDKTAEAAKEKAGVAARKDTADPVENARIQPTNPMLPAAVPHD